jgi:hypothetical protein
MQGPSWAAVLRRIPAALQDSVVIVTTTAIEIVIHSIARLEREYVVVRGRMSGSMDTGRVMFVPYDQINYVGVNRKLTEAEVQALLGKPGAVVRFVEEGAEVGAEPVEEVAWPPPAAAEPEPPPPPETPAPEEAAKATPKPAHPSKSVLLARLRARLTTDPPKPADT